MPSKYGFGNTRKKSPVYKKPMYGEVQRNPIQKKMETLPGIDAKLDAKSPLKDTVKTAEQTEKEAINKAKGLRQETIKADEKGDVLTANISEAGVRKTLNTPQYKAARKEASTKRYYS